MKKFLLTFSMTALAAWSGAAQSQTVLTASTWLPATHPATLAQKEWCDLLTTNTQGRVKCNLLPRAVSAPPGTFDAVKNEKTIRSAELYDNNVPFGTPPRILEKIGGDAGRQADQGQLRSGRYDGLPDRGSGADEIPGPGTKGIGSGGSQTDDLMDPFGN